MGLRDIFKRNKPENKEAGIHIDSDLLRALLGQTTIDRKTAMQIPEVSGCIDFIAGTIASLPIYLMTDINGVIRKVDNDNRVKLLNVDTYDTLDAYQMKKAMIMDYFLGKGGFVYISRAGNNIVGLHYVSEQSIVVMKNNDPIDKAGYYQITENVENIYPYEFIKLLRNTDDGLQGQSIIGEVAQALETAYNGIATQNKIFKRDGMKKGFIEAKSPLSEQAGKKLKEDWSSLYRGGENTILLNSGLTFNPANMSVQEMQLIEARKLLDEEIKNIFHIKANLSDTFNCALKPIIKQIETALNRDLLLESEKLHRYFYVDTADVFTATAKERYETYNEAIKGGYMSINEAREREHLNKIDGLDLYNLGLSSALFNPETKQIVIPNMGTAVGVEGQDNNIDEN